MKNVLFFLSSDAIDLVSGQSMIYSYMPDYSPRPISNLLPATNIESNNTAYLLKYFSAKELYQYNIILSDYNNSINFRKPKQDVIITSLDSWNINHKLGNIRDTITNGIFSIELYKLMNSYKQHNHSKCLIVYPHLGVINCTITIKHESNIVLTPAQMLCLELFTDKSKKYDYIYIIPTMMKNLSMYTEAFIENIIKSFIKGNILICCNPNDTIVKQQLMLNHDMPPNINLIQIFHNITNNMTDIIINTMIELAHERRDILMCCINSIIIV
jgi:hypothetical protein